jgi:hypothetical protein
MKAAEKWFSVSGVSLKVVCMKVLVLFLFSLLFCSAPALADGPGLVKEWDLSLRFEYFDWQEYGVAGARNVKEGGAMYGLEGAVLLDIYRQKLLLKLDGKLFGSVVDYQGHTQIDAAHPDLSERPVNTDVSYVGSDLFADLGWNYPLESFSFEPFAGVGYRWWLRGLQDSSALDTNSVPFATSGYTELWQSAYGKLGIRARYQYGNRITLFTEGGAKYPFYTGNSVDFVGTGPLTVRPGGRWSGFAEAGVTYRHLRFALSYEGFRYSQSPLVPVTLQNGPGFLYQPKSSSDIFGVNLGWSF